MKKESNFGGKKLAEPNKIGKQFWGKKELNAHI